MCGSSSRTTTATPPTSGRYGSTSSTGENYSTIGIGRPQETLEKYRDSLALVVGIMGQRFGSPTGKAESGTEEEFNWAMQSHNQHGYPEIKWFFRKADKLETPADPDEALKAVEQMEERARLPHACRTLMNCFLH
jgi:hypothetical protein